MAIQPGDNINLRTLTEYLAKYKQEIQTETLNMAYPVGSVYTSDSSENPKTKLGFGTWSRVEGKFIVGVSDSDGDFDLDDTGGVKSINLTHYHEAGNLYGYLDLDSTKTYIRRVGGVAGWASLNNETTSWAGGSGTRTNGLAMGGYTTNSLSNGTVTLPPYKAKYMWERTA